MEPKQPPSTASEMKDTAETIYQHKQVKLEHDRLALQYETLKQDRIRSELSLKEPETKLRAAEVSFQEKQSQRETWCSPLVIAILAAATAAGGNAVVALINGTSQRNLEETRATAARELERSRYEAQFELERAKAEAARILEVIKTGQDQALANLKF